MSASTVIEEQRNC